jgi:hypothetical protein
MNSRNSDPKASLPLQTPNVPSAVPLATAKSDDRRDEKRAALEPDPSILAFLFANASAGVIAEGHYTEF